MISRGEMPPGDHMGDFYLVRQARETKTLRSWAAPSEPLAYWLARLLPPGSLVGDPYAGSATTRVVCQQLAMRWIGTEIDAKAYRVARGRFLGASQGDDRGKPAKPL